MECLVLIYFYSGFAAMPQEKGGRLIKKKAIGEFLFRRWRHHTVTEIIK
jgi:hypothetical protein